MNVDLLVLAGGFGTRLKSILPNTPKVMAPIGKKPFLYYQIENWSNQGIKSFIFLLHYQAEQIIRYCEDFLKKIFLDCNFKYIIEDKPLGTGGAIAFAVNSLNLKSNFLVINADTWLSDGLAEMKNSLSPAIGIIQLNNTKRYGNIIINNNNVIKNFSEKLPYKYKKHDIWINSGLYHFNPNLFKHLKNNSFSLEKDFITSMVKQNVVRAIKLNLLDEFIDIGVPNDYNRFCEWHIKKK